MAYGANSLANLLLDLGDALRIPLSHMGIHKVLYYAHGWYLTEHSSPLVKEMFEAWEFGPVLRPVYQSFKGTAKAPVEIRAKHFDPITEQTRAWHEDVSDRDVSFLRNILRAYGSVDPLILSKMTHRAGGAWERVWKESSRIALGMIISNDSIRLEFQNNGAFNHDRLIT